MTTAEAPRSVLVTGAGGGIGGEVAAAFARTGAVVGVADVDPARAEAVVAEIAGAGGQAYAVTADVRDAGAVRAMFGRADAGEVPAVDTVVNAAGVIHYQPLVDLDDDALERIIDVNVKGAFLCTREAARRMVPLGHGSIVHIASVASFVATRLPAAAYGMSKGAVRQLTIAAAVELAPHGVRVNAVAPGTINTDFVQGSLDTDEGMARAIAGVPLGRLGTVGDVAEAVLFFASPAASFVTGQVLAVDGGRIGRAG